MSTATTVMIMVVIIAVAVIANRFARDLMVQEVGYAMLRSLGVTLVAADSPSSFLVDGPTSNLIRQILGAVSEFDISWLRPSHPNDFNHTFQCLAELTGKARRVVPSSTQAYP